MSELETFDVVLYEPEDIVIRKAKGMDVFGNNTKPEIIDRVDFLHAETYKYQVLYFKSNPNSAHVAWEFEPYDKEQLRLYNEALVASGIYQKLDKTKRKSTSTKKEKEESIKTKVNEFFKQNFNKMKDEK